MSPLVTRVAHRLLDDARSVLSERGRLPGTVHLAPGGEVAWDNCCEGEGQLWVRVVEAQPSGLSPFPSPVKPTPGRCGHKVLAVTYGVGTIRCAHTLDSEGHPPTAAQMTGDAEGMLDDLDALEEALRCRFTDVRGVHAQTIRQWTPAGPQGGCVGGEWTIVAGLDVCGCTQPEE